MSHQSISQQNSTAVTLEALIALRKLALQQSINPVTKKLTLPGQKLTVIRGRGIEFDATREYQAGDDIRSMAWRVTARSLKPHIKVYREEKERPAWLAIDLSPSLYFGTRAMFKSVRSITQATLMGWSSLSKREKIGAIISGATKPHVFQPKACEKYFLTILKSLAEASALQPPFNEKSHLHALLLTLQQQVRPGNLIYLYSDFWSFNAETERLLGALAERTQIILNFVYDPFESTPPPPYQYHLTNGQQKIVFNMQDAKNRENYRQLFQDKTQHLKHFARKHQMALNLYCTDPARKEAV